MTADRTPTWRHLLALLALVAQLVGGAWAPSVAAAAIAGASICHGGDGPADAPSPHHPDQCPLCPVCALSAASVALPAGGTVLLAPRGSSVGRAAVPPPVIAPSAARRLASQPRAPPFPA